jgi:uncharacterized protein
MEIKLFKALFAKLIEALRLTERTTGRVQADASAQRLVEAFQVTSDGIAIRGRIFFPVEKPSRLYPALLICHGIPGSGAPRPPDDPGYEGLAETFTAEGIAVAIFNFRGCGDSGGNFDMMGWSRDLAAVLDKVLNTPFIDPTRVMLLGFSGGGAAAIHVAADNPDVYSLAVVGTPAHFEIFERDPESIIADFRKRGIIRDPDFPPDVHRWLENFREIEPRRWISYFKGKHLFIVHGDDDELIPVEHARELYERAPSGITKLTIIAGGAHRLRLDPRCIEILKDWFPETLGWRK